MKQQRFLNIILIAALVLGLIPSFVVVMPTPVLAQDSYGADAVVLTNSTGAGYGDFQQYIQPYLDHFGIPYTELDIATSPVGEEIANYAVIIVGHRGLDASDTYLDATEEGYISAAVNAGTGLVNFDNDLSADAANGRYQFVQDVFGFGYGGSTTGSGVVFADPLDHYIAERHSAGETISTGAMTLAGVILPADVTSFATTGSQPFLAVTTHGSGRAVQFGSYDWISHDVKGPLFGLDDLFWRSIVWAARKPFVMQGMPPFVTMRMDDVSGPLWWIHTANDYGFIPWAGVFTADIDAAEAADLSNLVQSGNATSSIHAFESGTSRFFYYDHNNNTNFDDTTMANHYAEATQWFADRNIPIAQYVTPHYYEIGSNAFSGLQGWGVEYISTVMDPGSGEAGSTPWMQAGPFRLYESGIAGDRNQNIYYADYIPGYPGFFNCITEIRDVTGYEWLGGGRTSVPVATADGIEWLTRALDSMAVADLFSHEYTFISSMSQANWEAILQGITSGIADYDPTYVSRDDACQYARAVHDSDIASVSYDVDTRLLTTNLSGTTDVETKFYVFTEDAGQVTQYLLDVPVFSGTTQVDFTLPGPLTTITVTPNPADVVAGGTQQFTAQGYDAEGNPIPNLSFDWSVVNGGGTIDADGLFTAGLTAGTFADTVQAAVGAVTGSATVNITEPVLDHFSVTVNDPQYADIPFLVTVTARDAGENVVFSYTGPASLSDSTGTIDPLVTGIFTDGVWQGYVTLSQAGPAVTISATDGAVSGSSASFVVNEAPVCPCNIWDETATPANPNVNDGQPIEVGVKFRSDVDGYVYGVRFYKGDLNIGEHIGHLWDASGSLLAEATFVNESASGWQEVQFDSPVAVSANTTYVASYYSPGGYFSDSPEGLAAGVYNPPLRALANGADGPNGVYNLGSSAFPTDYWVGHAPNYWVDVVFDTAPPQPYSIWDDTYTPGNPAASDSRSIEVGVKFQAEVAGEIVGLRFYKGAANTGTHTGHLWNANGDLLAEKVFTNETASGWQEVQFTTPVAIDANTTFIASYFSPSGYFAIDAGYLNSGFDNPPLRALAHNEEGPNGVFNYDVSAFPTGGNGANYWVDVLFLPDAPFDSTPPEITSVSPADSVTGVNTYANITATFGEAMDPGTISNSTFELRDASSNLVPATVSYNAATRTATLDPAGQLAYSSSYAATVIGGIGGVADLASNELISDYTWSFTTSAPPSPPPDEGPGGPILVIAEAGNPFGRYFAEILRAEGLNAFTVTDISTVDAAVLAGYDVVIVGEMVLSAAQVTLLSDWVDAGGNLIAMRPDKQLAGLLGLADAAATQSEGYLLIDTTSGPGAGLVGETIQYHGTADLYTLASATALATLYSDATTSSGYPAVTVNSVGTNGGQAAAFTYDLARSVVLTRQGNPAWVDINGDGSSGPVRADDLFHNGTDPDWVNLDKVAIPQADEQQRLLANLILQTNLDNMPLPRFWYFPRGEKAVVLLTSDDHASSNVPGRMDQYKSLSPDGCSVEDWECVRSSIYIYPGTSLTEAQANSYTADGFEIGVHINTSCADYTLTGLEDLYNTQIGDFTARFPSLSLQDSERTHCIAWSGWAYQPTVKEQQGIRLDTNYYYWPPEWLNNRPGMFTGSGMPMRFTDLDGTMIDVYQATTQMTDESGQTYPYTIDALLDNALGPQGYFGVFTANMHTDSLNSAGANAIIASAQARGVPLVSGRQLVNWLDGRNGSSFANLTWSANTLSFDVQVGAGANGLQAMVPAQSAGGNVSGITVGGSPIAFTLQTIKGIQYAVFDAAAGAVVVSYITDETQPLVNSVSPTDGAIDVPTDSLVSATFSEPMDAAKMNTSTFELRAPGDVLVPATVTYDAETNTATLTPDAALDLDTSYTAVVKGGPTGVTDIAGNPLASDETWSFTTAADNCPCSIWDDTATPVSSAVDDGQPIELGTKFRSDSIGYITALRFYKGVGDTDTHVGHLWTSTGELLAEVTFTNETASGWQEMALPTPVPIEANTTYIASIFSSPVGYFSITLDYFATSGVDNPPLRALAAGEDGPNGVFVYGGGFPTGGTDNGYWVDVVFEYSTEDTTPPVISSVVATPNAYDTATITWETDEPADSLVEYGTTTALGLSASDAAMVMAHSVTLSDLAPNTTYYYRVASTDAASNSATEPAPPDTLQFTTPDLGFTDTTVTDFSNGESNTCYVAETGDGELILSPTEGVEFSGTSLPTGWTSTPWSGGVGTSVANGLATIDGTLLATDSYYGPGRSIEFVATFTGGSTGGSQHIGFGTDLNSQPWAIFSTGFPGSTTLKARSNSSTTELPSITLNEPHRFRIEWLADEVVFYVDGGEVARHAVSITAAMRPLASDQAGGSTITLDWMRMSPYGSSCTFESRVFDAGTVVSWDSLSWIADVPAGTSLSLSYRTGDTPTPDGTWTTFIPLSSSPAALGGTSQYIQYQAQLATTDDTVTPALEEVTISYDTAGDTTPPTIVDRTPAPDATEVAREANVVVNFSEPMDPATITDVTFSLRADGATVDVPTVVSYIGTQATLNPVDPLEPGTLYQVTVAASVADLTGNPLGSDDTWSFATAYSSLVDTTTVDFSAGSGACIVDPTIGDGALRLPVTIEEQFEATSLPTGWAAAAWDPRPGYWNATGGQLVVNQARAYVDNDFTVGHILEFVATFQPETYQHIGFVSDAAFNAPWILFSTGNTTTNLYARTNPGDDTVLIPGIWLGAPHLYRIEWYPDRVDFYIDDVLRHSQTTAISGPLRPIVSDINSATYELAVDWMTMTPYVDSCTFESRVLDAGASVDWLTLDWSGHLPTGTTVGFETRSGNTSIPDVDWSVWVAVDGSGVVASPNSQYTQYRATLATADGASTPVIESVDITYQLPTNSPPLADAGGPYSGEEGSALTLDASGSTDDGTLVLYEWDLDGDGQYDDATGDTVLAIFYDDGTYTVGVRVSDDLGASDTDTATVTVSDLGPTATFSWTPQPQNEGAPVSFTDGSTSSPDTIVTWSWDFAGLSTSTNPDPSFTFVDQGAYDVCLTVTDDDGSTDIVCHTVTVVNLAPTLSVSGDASVDEGSLYTLNLSAVTDPGDDTISDCSVDWGDGGSESCLDAIGDSLTHVYTDGPNSYTIAVDLVDEDGNYADVDTLNITVNNVAPGVVASNDSVTIDEGEVAANSGTYSEPGDDTVTLSASAGTITDHGDGTWSWSFDSSDGPDESQTVTITATDSDEASSTTAFDLVVDNVAPSVTADNATVSVDEGQTASNTGTYIDPGDDTVALTASAGTVTDNGNGSWSWSFDSTDGPDDNQTVTITATDSDGAVGTTTFVLTVDNAAPSVAADNGSVAVDEGQTAGNTGTYSDPGDDTVTLTASAGTVADNGNGTWSWSFESTDGPDESQTVIITATDSDGVVGTTTFALTVDNVAPSVAADDAAVTVNEGQTANNSGTYSDPGDDKVDLTASAGTITDNGDGTWSWSFDSTDGPDDSQVLTITATDSDGAVSTTTFDLVVNNVAPSVAADNAAVTVDEGQTASNTGTYSDPGGDTVTLTASAGTITDHGDGTWSWSFDSSDGPDESQTVTITATDSDGAVGTTTFVLTVDNVAPTVAADNATVTIDEGQAASSSGTYTDPGDDTVALTASVGTVTDNGDGTWGWSFDSTDGPEDSQTVAITATDSDGAVGTTTFVLTVDNVAPSVTADNAAVSVDEGQTASNTGTYSDPGDDTVALTASVGTVTDNGDGTWSWSFDSSDGPDESQAVTITAIDSDGASSIATFYLVVNNMVPVITLSGNAYVNEGVPYTLNLSAITDPGDDTISDCTVDWGDGSTSDCVAAIDDSLTHTYADSPILYTISIDLTDEDGIYSNADSLTVTVLPLSQVTDGDYCIFDRNPDTTYREFRLLFTPDLQNYPAFKLAAINPGQFGYNVFYMGDGSVADVSITIPYPFVTQGSTPVNVYSTVSLTTNDLGERCFSPGGVPVTMAGSVTLDSYSSNGSPGNIGDSVTLTFTDVPVDPDTGLVYLNIQLDYGLEDLDVDANDDGMPDRYDQYGRLVGGDTYYDAVNFDDPTETLIEDRYTYSFASNVDQDGDVIVNYNQFKVTPGVAGFVFEVDDQGELEVYTEGDLTVRLVIPKSVKDPRDSLEATPDEDGWYMIDYKHTGKPTNYRFEVYRGSELLVEKTVRLKGNEFEEVHIYLSGEDPPTEPPGVSHYVSELQGSSKVTKKSWNAMVLVAVLDQDENIVPNAQVSGIWTVNGDQPLGFCETDESGTCEVSISKIDASISSVSFDITDVFVDGSIYDAEGSETHVDVPR